MIGMSAIARASGLVKPVTISEPCLAALVGGGVCESGYEQRMSLYVALREAAKIIGMGPAEKIRCMLPSGGEWVDVDMSSIEEGRLHIELAGRRNVH